MTSTTTTTPPDAEIAADRIVPATDTEQLTLRDLLAGFVVMGIIRREGFRARQPHQTARVAYQFANELLAARTTEGRPPP